MDKLDDQQLKIIENIDSNQMHKIEINSNEEDKQLKSQDQSNTVELKELETSDKESNDDQRESNKNNADNGIISVRSFITNASKINQMEKTENKIKNSIQEMRKPPK